MEAPDSQCLAQQCTNLELRISQLEQILQAFDIPELVADARSQLEQLLNQDRETLRALQIAKSASVINGLTRALPHVPALSAVIDYERQQILELAQHTGPDSSP